MSGWCWLLLLLPSFLAPSTLPADWSIAPVPIRVIRHQEQGLASWYGRWHQGRRMANGQPFNRRLITGAHRHLPLGSWVRVRRLDTGYSLLLPITDRGPYVGGRIIDLSEAAARRLGFCRQGVVPITLEILP